MKEYNFSGEIIYKWEIGRKFITLYDDVSYRKSGFYNILDFFSKHFNMYIQEDNRCSVYQQSQNYSWKKHYLDNTELKKYNGNCYILKSHYSNAYPENDFHFFSCCFFVRRPLHMHIQYKKNVTKNEINEIIEALAEYLDKDVQTLEDTYQSILKEYSQNESSRLLTVEDDSYEKTTWRGVFCC